MRTSPWTLVSISASSSSSVLSSNRSRPSASPALFTRMSRPSSRWIALVTKLALLSASVTSSSSATNPSPRSDRSAGGRPRPPALFTGERTAVAAPIPLDAPVTIAPAERPHGRGLI